MPTQSVCPVLSSGPLAVTEPSPPGFDKGTVQIGASQSVPPPPVLSVSREIGLLLSLPLRVDNTTFLHCPSPGARLTLEANEQKGTGRLKPGEQL